MTFAFAGDTHFEGPLRNALAIDPAAVLASIAPALRPYDIAMVNLETAITGRGSRSRRSTRSERRRAP